MFSEMVKPAVTVLIDTYNHERFIEEAIVSVLATGFSGSGGGRSCRGRWFH